MSQVVTRQLLRRCKRAAAGCWATYRAGLGPPQWGVAQTIPPLSRGAASPATPRMTPKIQERLDAITARHAALVAASLAPDFVRLSPQEMAALGRDIAELEPVVEAAGRLAAARHELADVEELARDESEDAELREAAEAERTDLAERLPGLESELLLALVPRDTADDHGVVLEVRAGTGGEEACLFADELFRMYAAHAARRGWRWEVLEETRTEGGGLRIASAGISAPNGAPGPYGALKHESGVHRVQRVPATETAGRVHTSAASVAVLPEAEGVEVDVRDEDLRVDVYRSSGAGGQHVNCTNSAVRITHLPSGLVVTCQDERSQHKNKAKALKVLRARLYDAQRRAADAAQAAERKAMVGSGDRSERVRTYNFPQGRVTDHRAGLTVHGIDEVVRGGAIEQFTEALALDHQMKLLASLGA